MIERFEAYVDQAINPIIILPGEGRALKCVESVGIGVKEVIEHEADLRALVDRFLDKAVTFYEGKIVFDRQIVKAQILARILQEEDLQGRNLSREQFSHVAWWWIQLMIEGREDLCFDDFDHDIFYPYDPAYRSKVESIGETAVTNVEALKKGLRDLGLAENLVRGNMLVLVPHLASYVDIPFMGYLMSKVYGVSPENINIVLGPKLLTHKEGHLALGVGNGWRTFQAGQKGDILGLGTDITVKRIQFLGRLLRGMNEGSGKVFIIAPTGGRAEQRADGNFCVKPVAGAGDLVDRLMKKAQSTLICPFNDTDLVGVSGKPKLGKVVMNPFLWNSDSGRDPMAEMVKSLIDESGNRIAFYGDGDDDVQFQAA